MRERALALSEPEVIQVIQVIYLSKRKLNNMFLQSSRSRNFVDRGVGATMGVVGVSAGLNIGPANTDYTSEADETAERLASVIDYLNSHHSIVGFATPNLVPGQWIEFESEMSYGTLHEDAERLPDDVAFFATPATAIAGSPAVDTSLLLCGTVDNLCDRLESNGRIGSNCDWLCEVVLDLRTREQIGSFSVPSSLSEIRPVPSMSISAGQVIRWVHRIMIDDNMTGQLTKLRGYAQVLMDSSDPLAFRDRVVLATPLYVEFAPSGTPSKWQRLARKIRGRKRI